MDFEININFMKTNFFKKLYEQKRNSDDYSIKHKGYIDVTPEDQIKISKMQESGKYMLDLRPDSGRKWVIRKNPNYISSKLMVCSAVISTLLAGVSTYYIIESSKSKHEFEFLKKQTELQIEMIKKIEITLENKEKNKAETPQRNMKSEKKNRDIINKLYKN